MNPLATTFKTTLLASLLLVTACGGEPESTDAARPTEGQPAPVQPVGPALAMVEQQAVTEGEFNEWLKRRGVKDTSKLSAANRDLALEELISLTAMAQEAEKLGVARQPEMLNRLALQRKTLLADGLLDYEFNQRPISDAQIAAEYQRRKADMSITQYHARHILVAEQQLAQDLINRLNGGENFATLASEFSTEASKAEGGDLGWFELREMVKPFADEVKSLATGTFSAKPLKTELGWHIVKAEGNRVVPAPSLKEMAPQLRQLMRAQRIEQLIAGIKANYKVEIR